ncbi:hypothetical protein [Azoarcus taiwanensis]|uniref:Uncharacterized protein n=1 Tax=Azoarcus taiwanensis TaxID=666964 RepID=A0A972FEZ4_9RHOO|nr:hypothetical protein [Azoarcus taiwanensis]NMG04112.1 hypothetical protein [Azoarcus taiwanensis]
MIFPPDQRAVRASEKREIALQLALEEGLVTTDALAVRYGHRSTVAAHRLLKNLHHEGLLDRVRNGHKHLYFPAPAAQVAVLGVVREARELDIPLALLALDLRATIEAAGGIAVRDGRRMRITMPGAAAVRARLVPRMPTREALEALARDPATDALVFRSAAQRDAARRSVRTPRAIFLTPSDWRTP